METEVFGDFSPNWRPGNSSNDGDAVALNANSSGISKEDFLNAVQISIVRMPEKTIVGFVSEEGASKVYVGRDLPEGALNWSYGMLDVEGADNTMPLNLLLNAKAHPFQE